ncbi:MAG: hypothetical protein WBZ48_14565 [Bacteroidota bacterium]
MVHQRTNDPRISPSKTTRMQHSAMKSDALFSTEHFRDFVGRPNTGNLKVFVTRVPLPHLFEGMVNEGKRLLSLGVDAVVALDGERMEVDFPASNIVRPREVSFKKSKFYEMDYEAILRRDPEVVIIDNLLHVNISVSANEMRYHNVRDLVDQGISVVTSAYSAFGNNLKTAVEYVSRSFPASLNQLTRFPHDDIFTLVFTRRKPFIMRKLILRQEES